MSASVRSERVLSDATEFASAVRSGFRQEGLRSQLGGSGYVAERLQPAQPLTRDNSMFGFAVWMFFESDP
jgi:hypothetical protein